jgi:hypothetical protein
LREEQIVLLFLLIMASFKRHSVVMGVGLAKTLLLLVLLQLLHVVVVSRLFQLPQPHTFRSDRHIVELFVVMVALARRSVWYRWCNWSVPWGGMGEE